MTNAKEALERLQDGNRRFVLGLSSHGRSQEQERIALSEAQHPFAAVLCCSDSRVVPELIFDQYLGDLFVVRVAGNILDDAIIGSLEYAVVGLDVKLILVMAHENCGAVQAAIAGNESMNHIDELVRAIRPAVQQVLEMSGDLLMNTVLAHARLVTKALGESEPVLAPARADRGLAIQTACYSLKSGEVELL